MNETNTTPENPDATPDATAETNGPDSGTALESGTADAVSTDDGSVDAALAGAVKESSGPADGNTDAAADSDGVKEGTVENSDTQTEVGADGESQSKVGDGIKAGSSEPGIGSGEGMQVGDRWNEPDPDNEGHVLTKECTGFENGNAVIVTVPVDQSPPVDGKTISMVTESEKPDLKLGDTWECEHDDGPYTHEVTGFDEAGEALIKQTKINADGSTPAVNPEVPDDAVVAAQAQAQEIMDNALDEIRDLGCGVWVIIPKELRHPSIVWNHIDLLDGADVRVK